MIDQYFFVVLQGTNIVKGERDGKTETKFPVFDMAELHPILCKYRERRAQRQNETSVLDFACAGPLLYDINIAKKRLWIR